MVVSWLDNKVVSCATNYVTCNPVCMVVKVTQETSWCTNAETFWGLRLQQANGWCYLFDQFVSTFRVCIRSKKWWWPFFTWVVNTSIANAWNLFCIVKKQKIGMLEFQTKVVMTILASFERNKPVRSMMFPQNVASNVKLDTKNYILVKGISKYCRCKHCGGRSIYLCQRCYVVLHPDCFKDYH